MGKKGRRNRPRNRAADEKKRPYRGLSNEAVYQVARMLIEKGLKRTQITDWLIQHFEDELWWLHETMTAMQKRNATRTRIYDIAGEILPRNLGRLVPPRSMRTARKLLRKYKIDKTRRRIEIVDARKEHTLNTGDVRQEVAMISAEVVLQRIHDLGGKKADGCVHVGFGAGITTMNVARHLGQLIDMEPYCPELAIHALTSGFSMDSMPAPVMFFRFFDTSKTSKTVIRDVPLFSAPTVQCGRFDELKTQPVVREAFAQAVDIDIVVTSLAAAGDEHGLLNQFLVNQGAHVINRLRKLGWVGDVQFRPYSSTGPIKLADDMIRAVTLFELEDLVRLAGTENKYVILVAGPCNECETLKEKALAPLMAEEKLRAWSHLIADIETGEKLLKLAP